MKHFPPLQLRKYPIRHVAGIVLGLNLMLRIMGACAALAPKPGIDVSLATQQPTLQKLRQDYADSSGSFAGSNHRVVVTLNRDTTPLLFFYSLNSFDRDRKVVRTKTEDKVVGMPTMPIRLPGRVGAEVTSRWLAPYVCETTRVINNSRHVSVVWYTPEGKVKRELVEPPGSKTHLYTSGGFVNEVGADQPNRFYATAGDWAITLPNGPDKANIRSIRATEDGRFLVHEFGEKKGEIIAQIYFRGKLVGTVGPFIQYLGRGARLNAIRVTSQ